MEIHPIKDLNDLSPRKTAHFLLFLSILLYRFQNESHILVRKCARGFELTIRESSLMGGSVLLI